MISPVRQDIPLINLSQLASLFPKIIKTFSSQFSAAEIENSSMPIKEFKFYIFMLTAVAELRTTTNVIFCYPLLSNVFSFLFPFSA